jgi:molybdate transport system ATP-binding protein
MISVAIEKRLKGYGGAGKLHVKYQFDPGITLIHGPSGAGKTTLLKIIAGLVSPEHGQIRVNDTIWLDTEVGINLSPQIRRVGFVFQDYALFPNMSVMEHLQYATVDKDWITRLLHLGKLETLTTHKPAYLSGGQQQRLAILRALAIKPQVILMDEPFSALDKTMKTDLIKNLRAVFKELNATVLIVSHNPDELIGIANADLYIAGL